MLVPAFLAYTTGNQTNILIIILIIAIAIIGFLLWKVRKIKATIKLHDEQKEKIIVLEKQLNSFSNEKAKLLSIVSHDIKSPFNRIFALVNLMKMNVDELSDEHQEYLTKIHQVVKDGMSLIRNMLDMRSIEGKGIIKEIQEIDLIPFLKSILKNAAPLAEMKKIKLKFSTEKESIAIKSDKQYLTRIVENLISNGLKFSTSGQSVGIKVTTTKKDVKIKIVDEGPGISVEDQKKLYEKYQVLTAKPTDGESATGLGLFIVNSLVKTLGGSITCESEETKGTSFIITLQHHN